MERRAIGKVRFQKTMAIPIYGSFVNKYKKDCIFVTGNTTNMLITLLTILFISLKLSGKSLKKKAGSKETDVEGNVK